MREMLAEHVRAGDTIDWCGMRAVVVDVAPDNGLSRHRRGIHITVEVPGMGERRLLHYWADETVRVREP